MNKLYYGDNLDILREHIKDESVALIYLDPPFKSDQNYNVLFKEQNGSKSVAQIQAFEDTWHWDRKAVEIYDEILQKAPKHVADLIVAFQIFLGNNDLLAYLVMMAIRLIELHRILKPTGSIYLHCDPTASHYLKLLMDAVFGGTNFQNEIIWRRSNSPKSQSKGFGTQHDIILLYGKSSNIQFHKIYTKDLDDKYLKSFCHDDDDGKGSYQTVAIVAGGLQKYPGRKEFEFKSVKAPWLYSKEKLERWWKEGLIYKTKTGMYRKKVHLKNISGKIVSDLWTDKEVNPLQGISKEKIGYPTQKPESLLERILNASSKEGDLVLDPFCGCGTTIIAAEKLKRQWIGIDITHLAIALMKYRVEDTFDYSVKYEVVGEPKDVAGAKYLAEKGGRFQFESWALGLVKAKPTQKTADRGIDGNIYFQDDPKGGPPKQILIQVKSGAVHPSDIRDLKGTVDREKAAMGVMITLQEPTKGMKQEALAAGYYISPYNKKYDKIQILTIEDLFKGAKIDRPPEKIHSQDITFKKPRKHRKDKIQQPNVFKESTKENDPT